MQRYLDYKQGNARLIFAATISLFPECQMTRTVRSKKRVTEATPTLEEFYKTVEMTQIQYAVKSLQFTMYISLSLVVHEGCFLSVLFFSL